MRQRSPHPHAPDRGEGAAAPARQIPHSTPFISMNFIRYFSSRSHRRSTLRDLYASGLVSVFRRPSLFRLWEPLREHASADADAFSD